MVITLTDVWRIYSRGLIESVVLQDISLTVPKGEFLCFAGPSGSGKTTLLNLIGALDLPSRGAVVVAGQSTGGLDRRQRALFRRGHIGFVFQSYNLIPVLSLYENVEYPLILNGYQAGARRELVNEALEMVGLTSHRSKRPAELSGGQQQRAAVARAIVGRPPIILADEPTGSLDSENGRKLMDILRNLNKKFATTCVFSSHDSEVIKRADRVVMLKDGKIV